MSIVKKKKARPILVFGDLHSPYHHKLAIDFLKRVHKDYGCKAEVVCVGDMYDFHAMSRHTTEPDAPSPEAEYKKAQAFVKKLTQAFPKGVLILGNHDLIPQRQMKENGLSDVILKDYNSLYGLPKGWRVEPLKYIIQPWDVLVQHGINTSGGMGALNKAIGEGCSYVQGHIHAEASVHYFANHQALRFALNTGCLCDNTALAMRYAKYSKKKGVLGCGVIYGPSHAIFVPMTRERKGKKS